MTTNSKLNEKIAVLAALNPASVAASTVVTTWVPVSNFHSVSAMLQTGVMGASGTIDAKLRQATDASGTGAKDIAGKAIVQIVKASGDNVQATIGARVDDLDTNNGFTHVALSVTVGTAASLLAAQVIGSNPRFMPPANAASVVQIVG